MKKSLSQRKAVNADSITLHQSRGALIEIGFRGERFFSLNEANDLFPIINKLTRIRDRHIGDELARLERLLPCDPRTKDITQKVAPTIIQWKRELEQLGCRVFDLSYIGFFNGEGFYLGRADDKRLRYAIPYGASLDDKVSLAKFLRDYPTI